MSLCDNGVRICDLSYCHPKYRITERPQLRPYYLGRFHAG